MPARLLKKIVTKQIMGDDFEGKKIVDALGAVDLYSVIGTCSGIIPDETQYGNFFQLTGAFEASRNELKDKEGKVLVAGEVMISSTCILPEPAGNMFGEQIMAVIRTEKQEGEDVKVREKNRKKYSVNSAQFAVIVGIKPSKKGQTGYEWTVRPIVAPAAVDTLQDLRGKLQAALPAPEVAKKAK